MEEIKNNKQYKILLFVFIVISIIHVVYATVTMRGMYLDGGFYTLQLLQNISDKVYTPVVDYSHTRFFIQYLQEIPVYIANVLFHVNNKFALMMVYSFGLFAMPLLALWWNFKLTERTGRTDVLLWSLFNYCAILITFQIFSVVEIILGATLHFILWNYMVSDIKYTKRDILFICILLIIMFGTYEYVVFLGFIFFIASFGAVIKSKSLKSQAVKSLIGFGALAASIFDLVYMFKQPGENSEILRFLKEGWDYLPHAYELNILLTIVAVGLLLVFVFINKKKLHPIATLGIVTIFFIAFAKLILTRELSVYPMWEQHIRTIPCWLLPIIFMGMFISDVANKEKNQIKIYNMICIVLICGIFQTVWQLVDTYYWDKNIQYMKYEIAKTSEPLYIPSEHELISDFHTPSLRRYIWHGTYAFTSILFSENYEQKTLLVNYDKSLDYGNITFRESLFVYTNPDGKEPVKMSIPYGTTIDIKNKYWDLTKCAKALDEYNKQNDIQTWQ